MKRIARRVVFMAVFLPLWVLLRPVVRRRAHVIFAVYGTHRDAQAYYPAWFDRPLRRLFPVFPIGVLRTRVGWGLVVASAVLEDELDRDPQHVASYVQHVTSLFPRARGIALGGRLPTWYYRSGNAPTGNVVDGAFGTRFAMLACVAHAARHAGIDPAKSTLCLLGGGGRIGKQIAHDLARVWSRIIALDTRFREEQTTGTIVRTGQGRHVELADLTLVLTARGRDVEPYIEFFRPGSLVVDDTHPTMPPEVVTRIISRGVHLSKAMNADVSRQLRFTPHPRGLRPDDAPGCLIEALVVAEHGPEVLQSFDRFVEVATDMFAPILYSHETVW